MSSSFFRLCPFDHHLWVEQWPIVVCSYIEILIQYFISVPATEPSIRLICLTVSPSSYIHFETPEIWSFFCMNKNSFKIASNVLLQYFFFISFGFGFCVCFLNWKRRKKILPFNIFVNSHLIENSQFTMSEIRRNMIIYAWSVSLLSDELRFFHLKFCFCFFVSFYIRYWKWNWLMRWLLWVIWSFKFCEMCTL